MAEPEIVFFPTSAAFARWLRKHSATATEVWAGFYKRESGRPSMTWPESVDEALCVGWIDGIRKSIDAKSYKIRFTRRKAGSIWSSVNVRKAEALIAAGRMMPTGLAAFEARTANKSGVYSYEQRPAELPEEYAQLLWKNPGARKFFDSQPPSYRKTATWWVVSARKEETRLRRMKQLIADSAAGERIGLLRHNGKWPLRRLPP